MLGEAGLHNAQALRPAPSLQPQSTAAIGPVSDGGYAVLRGLKPHANTLDQQATELGNVGILAVGVCALRCVHKERHGSGSLMTC
jgi:hypothetical protein